ncbi:MAG: S41 family peptidase [Gammaproteobacteria bacterium]
MGAERYLDKPVLILVSEKTFSLAEQLAYGMKHFDKATIIGRTSSGAAHAIDFLEVNDNYASQIPVTYSIHPVTGTDWEGTGVVPHIVAPVDQALRTAHLNALETLIDGATIDRIKDRYHSIKDKLVASDKAR